MTRIRSLKRQTLTPRALPHIELELLRPVPAGVPEGILKGSWRSIETAFYDTRKSLWVKIKNPAYSQAEGREELFEELRT
jgi:hypothetical protein